MPGAIGMNAGQAYVLAGMGFIVPAAAQQPAARSAGFSGSYGRAGVSGAPGAVRQLQPVALPGETTDDSTQKTPSTASSSSQGDDNAIVAQARKFMANEPYNSNNGTHNWSGYCLGFVHLTMRTVRGHDDGDMAQYSAKDAYFAMAHDGRINNNVKSIPAGAAVFWAYASKWGHVAIATGATASDGSPMIITTTSTHIKEMSVKQQGFGNPTGWGKI